MRVVADAGPPHYLILAGAIDILPQMFGRVTIPSAVREELSQPRTPDPVRFWMAAPPSWIEVADDVIVRRWPELGRGERATLALALASRADLALMDDRRGVVVGLSAGLRIVGTLGLLDRAAARGHLDLPAAISRLRATNFRCRPAMFDKLLDDHAGRMP